MKKYFVTTRWIKLFFPKILIWEIPTHDKIIYLTFDDGPTPGVTEKVLDILNAYQAKATFFCIGKNVMKYPDLYKEIINQNHAIGNHSHYHKNAIRIPCLEYYEDLNTASKFIQSNLFRPPYGRIRKNQVKILAHQYKIIMWSVLSGDFDTKLNKENCKNNVIKYTKEGSIVVFHDSIKAKDNMFYALQESLKYFHEKGYRFKAIKL